jgi:hypothetical protein
MEPTLKVQYQHYIPQFLLCRFATASSKDHKKNRKRTWKLGGDPILNTVNLAKNLPTIDTRLVRRTFGQNDMYKDDSGPTAKDQERIERKLGRIESDASRIIAKAVVAHQSGNSDITIIRSEQDVLQKFLFIMKYRSPIFFKRFNHQTADGYASNDRTQFLKYMRGKNFKRPLDVWFDNLIKIIETPMDPDGQWMTNITEQIYPGDALWLLSYNIFMYLAFVTPAGPGDEFILTENAYGIHEGPIDFFVKPTGERIIYLCTEFHLVNVVSPHLVMVLRYKCLPEFGEDEGSEIYKAKKEYLARIARMHKDPDHATFSLQHLPVTRPKITNRKTVEGKTSLADDVSRATDLFRFPFFRLQHDHVQTINTIMLESSTALLLGRLQVTSCT